MQSRSTVLSSALMIALIFCFDAVEARARQQSSGNNPPNATATADTTSATKAAPAPSVEDRLRALEQVIERQQREIQSLHELIEKEKRGPQTANARTVEASRSEATQPTVAVAVDQTPASGKNEAAPPDQTQKRVDELYKKFGAIRFSGDIRFRAETFRNQGFDSIAEAPARNRLRVRVRLALDGSLNKHFDWGVKMASGIFTDPISSNQTFTDFYERKPFALERAFVRYDSIASDNGVGVQLVAGKFEPTFRRTQMVWDDDVNVEGASEALYFKTTSSLKQIKLVAFQLPFNELSAAKDGVLYGGQFQSDWQFAPTISANVNVSYYDWNRADQIALGLGALATQVNGGIFNGAGLTGNQNGPLGTSNRLVRNASGAVTGFLAGFNLFDVLGNLTWQAGRRMPVTFTFDYVRNLTSRIDDEKNGYWAGVQVGQTREVRDWLIGYTFTRIEQDAVLVPFNFSDILASNSRVHIPTFAYQVANGVTLQWTGLFSQRVNKVVLISPSNRWLNRMQFDVIYKF
ncbi:MAG TPA: putative porin [Blastocatellia bacterium]|nr:putative porin [Blastocatellia bacterium]